MTNDSNRRNSADENRVEPAEGDDHVLRRGRNPAGQAEFDSRGNSVWRWRSSLDLDSTSRLLKQLENDELSLEPTRRVPVPGKVWERGDSTPGHKPPASGASPGAGKRRDDRDRNRARAPARELGLADDDSDSKGHGGFDPYNKS